MLVKFLKENQLVLLFSQVFQVKISIFEKVDGKSKGGVASLLLTITSDNVE